MSVHIAAKRYTTADVCLLRNVTMTSEIPCVDCSAWAAHVFSYKFPISSLLFIHIVQTVCTMERSASGGIRKVIESQQYKVCKNVMAGPNIIITIYRTMSLML